MIHHPIPDLRIHRFRSFQDLAIGPFGRVNLITGKNNAGKSSLLEAMRILATDGAPSTIHKILSYREESTTEKETASAPTDSSWLCSIFPDFPPLSGCSESIVISTEGKPQANRVEIKVGWYREQVDDTTGMRHLIPTSDADLFGDVYGFPVLEITTAFRNRRIRLDSARSFFRRNLIDSTDSQRVACIYVDPFSSGSTSTLGSLWDSIALTKSEQWVVEALRIISDDIEGVSMIGNERVNRARTAIVKSSRFHSPVPLRSFGDGLNRVFGIILSLVNAEGGVLLVDEIENGLHHSVLADVWKVIFTLAVKLNVQVFATSHSWECIGAFQSAANDNPEDGVLVRLERRGNEIVPTLFTEHEIRIAAREEIELR